MPEPSSSIGSSVGRIAGRMARRRVDSDRILSALWSAGSATFRSVSHVIHLLFLEVTGFLFLCFSVGFGGVTVREYHKYKAGVIGPGKAVLAACFALMFLWFGLSSFWRAKRKKK